MKLQTKVLATVCPVFVLSTVVIAHFVNLAARNSIVGEAARRGVVAAAALAETESVVAEYNRRREQRLLPPLQALQNQTGAFAVAVLDPTGAVVAHTNVSEKGKVYADPLTRRGLAAPESLWEVTEAPDGPEMNIYVPLRSMQKDSEEFLLGNRPRIGTVRLTLPLDQALKTAARMSRIVFAIVAGTGAAMLGVIVLVLRRILLPLDELAAATRRIAVGELGGTVPVGTSDEIGFLAQSFNRMSESLAKTTVSKDYVDAILKTMLDALIVTDLEGRIVNMNDAACAMIGRSVDELIGTPARELFPPETGVFGENWLSDLRLTNVKNVEMKIAAGAAGTPILFSASLMNSAGGAPIGVVVTAKDIAERKRLEIQLIRSEKLSAVGQLAAGVSHEINNPLGVILGFAQGVVRRMKEGDPLEVPLKSIEREALRCKNLVQDLLTFSRAHKGDREPLEINLAVAGALSLVEAQGKMRQVTVVKDLAPELPRVFGNKNQIQQVIINLANNALDAMPEGGELKLRTSLLEDGIRSWVVMKVTDTGTGIPADVISRIFEPFFTTKEVGKGTGLGLSLVYEIVRRHSGTIDVASRPGLTEFSMKFPVRTGREEAPEPYSFASSSGEARV